jgi:tagaturonate reductase
MRLSNKTLVNIKGPRVVVPVIDYLKLPVKVLQFGTGVLLRGLTNYIIDKANRNGVFNGRIAVVKSTNIGNTTSFIEQDNLYTLQIKGIENKQLVNKAFINTSISHILSAADEWDLVLREVENPDLKVIISNTTEIGIQLVEENINQHPPKSFPAKLLAVLYHRYKSFNGSHESGLVIIPTELLPNNATVLQSIIEQLIAFNKLELRFENWIKESNHFCNSLVDRIVTGRPSHEEQQLFEKENGYNDELLIVSEPYCLWAIEGDDKVKSILSFEKIDAGVIVVPNIEVHRELKLRMLNGTHTLSCALAFLIGFSDVNTATNDSEFMSFMKGLMFDIRLGMPYKASPELVDEFSERVLDRFKNPYIAHQWINIAQQYTTKIITRVLPILKEYKSIPNHVPVNIAKGFAAYLFLTSKVKENKEGYYLEYNNVQYPFKDDKARLLIEKWRFIPLINIAYEVLSSKEIWTEDLSQLSEFVQTVQHYLNKMAKGDLMSIN